jgi:plasmid stabilization system protein ParE
VVTRLREMRRLLAGAPAMGRDRPEFGPDVRSFVADHHVLFYRPLKRASGIGPVRVLRGIHEIDSISSGDED